MADVLLAIVLIAISFLGAELTMRTCRRRLSRPVTVRIPVAPLSTPMVEPQPAFAESGR